jgi:hypothetical protein
MKCEISRKWLQDVLKAAVEILPVRCVNPVMQCVRLSAEPDGLYVEAASADNLAVRKRVPHATVVEEGQAVVPPERLAGWLGQSGEAICTLEVRGNELWCYRDEGDAFSGRLHDEKGLPRVDPASGDPVATFEGAALARAMGHALVVVDPKLETYTDDKRNVTWATAGVILRFDGGMAYAEGTDTKCVCQSNFPAEASKVGGVFVGVPMARLLEGVAGGGPVRFGVQTGGAVWFAGDGWTVSGPQGAGGRGGKGAPIGDMVAKSRSVLDLKATVEAADFLRAVEAALLGADEKDRNPAVVVRIGHNAVRVTCSGETATATRQAPCQYDGDEVSVRLCGTRLRRLLRAFDKGSELTARFKAVGAMFLLSADDSRLYGLSTMELRPSGGK